MKIWVIFLVVFLVVGGLFILKNVRREQNADTQLSTLAKQSSGGLNTGKSESDISLREAERSVQKIAANAKEALDFAKNYTAAKGKVDYLLRQAKSLYESRKFQDVVDIAQYILSNINKNSSEANGLLEQAKEAVALQAKQLGQKAVEGVGSKINDLSERK
ncbi:MAG: hypothetical protein ABH872_04855 [Candidatus Omnitrophota bacterium]